MRPWPMRRVHGAHQRPAGELSCLSFAALHEGDEITTIEGVGQPEKMHPMQAAFVTCDAYQCGYCTSGQIMSAVALLKEPCGPDDAEVKEFMSGNICRCGAYPNIVAAIQKCGKTRGRRSRMKTFQLTRRRGQRASDRCGGEGENRAAGRRNSLYRRRDDADRFDEAERRDAAEPRRCNRLPLDKIEALPTAA